MDLDEKKSGASIYVKEISGSSTSNMLNLIWIRLG